MHLTIPSNEDNTRPPTTPFNHLLRSSDGSQCSPLAPASTRDPLLRAASCELRGACSQWGGRGLF